MRPRRNKIVILIALVCLLWTVAAGAIGHVHKGSTTPDTCVLCQVSHRTFTGAALHFDLKPTRIFVGGISRELPTSFYSSIRPHQSPRAPPFES